MSIQPLSGVSSPAAGALSPERKAKLQKAATDIESVFVAQIMKESRPKPGMMSSSFAAQTFQDMLGQQLAQDMAKKGVLGLADQLVRQVLQQQANIKVPDVPASTEALPGEAQINEQL